MSDNEKSHLVIVEASKKKVESYAATLKSAGLDLQLDQVQGIKGLATMFDTAEPQLVLYGGGARTPDLETVAVWLDENSQGIPLIAVETEAMPGSGASAVVSPDQPDELVATIRRVLDKATLNRRVSRLEEAVDSIRLQQRIDRLERALQEQEKDCTSLVENSRDAIAYVFNGHYLYANPACLRRFGDGHLAELKGTPLLDRVDADDHAGLEELLQESLDAGEAVTVTLGLTDSAGVSHRTAVEFSPARFENTRCTRMLIRAPARRAITAMQAGNLEHEDLFTGTYNRQYFMQLIEDTLITSDTTDWYRTVTYVLLDDFRTIRENFGIYACDQTIRNITALIRQNYNKDDTVAQFGDYVFAILSTSQHEDRAYLLAEALRKKIKKHVTVIGGKVIQTSCSIGMCAINDHMKNAQDVLSRADLACEVARSSGGNLVHIHSTAIDEQIDGDIGKQWDDMIRQTIDDERLYLVYQPIVSLSGNAGRCYEVLLRVVDEKGQVILPGQFVSLAGKTGLSSEIDRWVISSALRSLRNQDEEDGELSFFVKISGPTLLDDQFATWVQLQLQEQELQGRTITFEIPEIIAVRNVAATSEFIRAMHKLGCKIAIEHFGYLSQPEMVPDLAVDFLKIDGSLIENLAFSSENQARVRSVVDFARTSKAQCIAERVDDANSLVTLWQYNVDFIQGNFVREPGKQPDYDFEDAVALHSLAES